MKVQKGSRGISLLFFNLRCGCGGWSRPPTGRFSTGQTWYPLYKELDGLQGRSGRAQENSPPPGFDSRTFRSVAAGYTNYVILVHPNFHTYIYIYRVSQEKCEILRESVPYVKLYRYNPKHLYPKLNGYGDNGQRSLKL